MALSTKPWDGSASNYDSAQAYCSASLVNTNAGPASGWTKAACSLPVREPNGDLSRDGMAAAASALVGGRGGVDLSVELKRRAAAKLVSLYRSVNLDPPTELAGLAHGGMNDAIRARAGR